MVTLSLEVTEQQSQFSDTTRAQINQKTRNQQKQKQPKMDNTQKGQTNGPNTQKKRQTREKYKVAELYIKVN